MDLGESCPRWVVGGVKRGKKDHGHVEFTGWGARQFWFGKDKTCVIMKAICMKEGGRKGGILIYYLLFWLRYLVLTCLSLMRVYLSGESEVCGFEGVSVGRWW